MDSYSVFRELLLSIPSQIQSGIEAAKNIKFNKKPDQIIFCGMGGSALAAEFLKAIFAEYKISIPVCIHKDYDLPLTATKNSVIVCISYSGNTEETISSFKKAASLNLKTVAIAGGGKLKKIAARSKALYINIPAKNVPPRISVLCILSSLIKVMANSGILSASALAKLISGGKDLKISEIEKQGHHLAEKIADKIPLIYSSVKLSPLAYFLKIAFNENSKIHAFSNVLPECQHNEIQGFSDPVLAADFYAIFLKERSGDKKINRRIDIMMEMLDKRNFEFSLVEISSKNIFENIVSAIIFSGFASLKLANALNHDPLEVPIIEELKKALK